MSILSPPGGILQLWKQVFLVAAPAAPNPLCVVRHDGQERFSSASSIGGLCSYGPDEIIYSDVSAHCIFRLHLFSLRIVRMAGSGSAGLRDGPWDTAQFRRPTGLACQPNAVFVCDSGNHCIRQLKVGVGGDLQVSVIAGTAVAGLGDGIASHCRFNGPTRIAFLTDKQIVVSDTGNHRLRLLEHDSTRGVWRCRTLTGGQQKQPDSTGCGGLRDGSASDSQFHHPIGLLVCPLGVLVADTGNMCLRLLSPSLKIVRTVIIDCSPGLQMPAFVDICSAGESSVAAVSEDGELHILSMAGSWQDDSIALDLRKFGSESDVDESKLENRRILSNQAELGSDAIVCRSQRVLNHVEACLQAVRSTEVPTAGGDHASVAATGELEVPRGSVGDVVSRSQTVLADLQSCLDSIPAPVGF
mmetsp:Transcript_119817/g.274461  ORF Transcript_119817/g.274461 Transcript_119817/m.274461 type:complete len:414 (+) Transcript_119817:197-1438(+)